MAVLRSLKGVLPTSMLDWPGKICTVVFLSGCNFRCPYCHNPELLGEADPGSAISWEDLSTYLLARRSWIDGVSLTGGEPTIHRDLKELCLRIKELEMPVKLDTNGSHPRLLEEIIGEGYLDFVAMDLKTSLDNYQKAVRRPVDPCGIESSIDLILSSGLEHEFRCTVVPGIVAFEDLLNLATRLEGTSGFVLQQFNPEKTLEPGFSRIKPYSEDLLEDWADRLSRLVPTTIRGLVGLTRK